MKYPDTSTAKMKRQAQCLYSAHAVCMAAQQFYQQAAQQISNSNLRYKFLELSALHLTAAKQLPATAQAEHDYHHALAAVEIWYLHQCTALYNPAQQPFVLTQLGGLLQQQLQGLKQLIKQVTTVSAKIRLAHLSAALQMATDQLLPQLDVLSTDGKKITPTN